MPLPVSFNRPATHHVARRLGVIAALAAVGACADQPTRVVAPAIEGPARNVAAPSRAIVLGTGGLGSDFSSRVAAIGGSVARLHGAAGIAIVDGVDAASLKRLPGVRDAIADFEIQVVDRKAAETLDLTELGDPSAMSQADPTTGVRYSWQWNMRAIGANVAWAAGKLGDASVTAAILDSGIDYDITDLNGLVDLSRSASFVASDDQITSTYFPSRHPITDYDGHGTNVATQVSSKAIVHAGVTSKTTLIGVKVLGRTGSGAFSGILNGVLWAADNGADVANMSLGGDFPKIASGTFIGLINRVFQYAWQRGTLVVVAAGNSAADLDRDGNNYSAFCGTPNVVCVSAVGPLTFTGNPDVPAQYTNYGRSVIDVAAPGGNADFANGLPNSVWPWGVGPASFVWSYCSKTRLAGLTAGGVPVLAGCQAGNRVTGMIGTSQAAPHVAGLAAMLIAEYGRAKPAQIKQLIVQSALDLGQPGTDPFYGKGRISVAKALGL